MADLTAWQLTRVAATGGTLAFVAGFVNAVSASAVFGAAASHVTGVLTRLAADALGHGSPVFAAAAAEGAALGGYLAGALAAGAVLGPSPYYRMRVTARHGAVLLLEAAALLAAALLLGAGRVGGCFFAAAAMGLQNGGSTVYSGALLRTTHMTGVWTDLGVLVGQRLHQAVHVRVGRREERALVRTETWRFAVLLPLVLAFFAGALAGVQGYVTAGLPVLAFPIVATAVLGAAAIILERTKLAREQRASPFSRLYDKTAGLLRTSPAAAAAAARNGARGVGGGALPRDDDMFAIEDLAGGFSGAVAAAAAASAGAAVTTDEQALQALGARGDWDTLPYAMYVRHKRKQLLATAAATVAAPDDPAAAATIVGAGHHEPPPLPAASRRGSSAAVIAMEDMPSLPE
jgi:uncharacterized membrane protein YoaK (UPF0700 family)